jgi:antitoxin CptB
MSEARHIRWRCRRGTKELDIIFERFLRAGYAGLDEPERTLFERLLDEQDDRLQAWFLGVEPPPREFAELVRLILAARP